MTAKAAQGRAAAVLAPTWSNGGPLHQVGGRSAKTVSTGRPLRSVQSFGDFGCARAHATPSASYAVLRPKVQGRFPRRPRIAITNMERR